MGKRNPTVHKNRKSGDLFSGFLNDLEMEFESDIKPPFIEWVEGIILDGKKFSFKNHEYLITPYQDEHPYMIFLKGAQLGLTVLATLRVLYKAIHDSYNILYLFPSRNDVSDYSRSRVTPLIEGNPDLIGKYIRSTDSINLKQINDSFLYLRGMNSEVGLRSIPVDFIAADELDCANQTALGVAQERLAHSKHKIQLLFSNPSLPDYGVGKYFEETDQRYWLLKCPKCNHYTNMVDTFPDCLLEVKGKVIRACEKCQAELNPAHGEWIAKRPSITDRRGYQFSQLYSHYVDPCDILHQFKTTDNLATFYNYKLGLPYVTAEDRLSVEEVLYLCGNKGIAGNSHGSTYMGCDQGSKKLHVVIGKTHDEKRCEVIYVGVCKDFEELDILMRKFNVVRCILDAMPETRAARSFAERFPGRVYLNYYLRHAKGEYRWNDKAKTVSVNRTEVLDVTLHMIQNQEIILPRDCDEVKILAKHCHGTAKKLIEEEDTGSKRYEYIKLGEDHYFHSLTYLNIAMKSNISYMYESFALNN